LRDPAAKSAPDRRPLWLPLHSAAARQEASLRSVPQQPNPQGKEQHQENSRSSLISSFSPYCSLIKSTKPVSEMLARRDLWSLWKIIRGSHILRRLMRLSFIAFRLAFTSFFTNVIGTGLPTGKLTMAFVVAKPASSFLCCCITGGRTCRRMCGFLKLNQANIPS